MPDPTSAPACSVLGCTGSHKSLGLCNLHYRRLKRTGTTDAPVLKKDRGPVICSIDGCGKPVRSYGWCTTHYERWKTHGDPLATVQLYSYNGAPCSIDGCGNPARSRGWCGKHWQRWKKFGDPLMVLPPSGPPRKDPSPCTIDACVAPIVARGWCRKHYSRWKKNGDPEALAGVLAGESNTNWRGTSAGYNAKHQRVQRLKGKADSCVWGCQETYRYEWACMTGDYDNPDDYVAMCVLCHRRYDRAVISMTRGYVPAT